MEEEAYYAHEGITSEVEEEDAINPSHYKKGGMEVVDIIEAFAKKNVPRSHSIKYLLRAGEKGDTREDLQKAIWWIEREINNLKEE